ncbi:MAG: type II secretion system protein GspE [Actinobacteria bacterium]|nr:MAG: type II secretion system protein GspE [Actinomycetota bacterium]
MAERNQLGSLLVDRGLVSRDQLGAALEEQSRSRKPLGRILVEQGTLSETDLVATLAAQMGLEFVDLDGYPVDQSAVATISDGLARRYEALPVSWDESGHLVVAMADPSNVFALDDIRTITGADVRTVVATRAAVLDAIDKHHSLGGEVEDISAVASSQAAEETDLSKIREVVEDAPIVKLVNLLITQAIQERASDIHVEPTEKDLRIRYRVDGVLHEKMRSPKNIQQGLTSRLKIMADINIAERRIPQDGRVSIRIQDRTVDLRVATLPTVFGEKVVMRILDKGTALLDLADLGFLPANLERFATAYRKPYGTILVTGPTGSGKSTTLYATLNVVNDVGRNIITVEDPVEYRLPGINQCQVNPKAGMTFAAALRSILRSDPDVVLVGEIRDRETAVIAVEAALTGHLVLSTLHTNDASTTPTRLVEMGVEPFLVSSALDCVVAQRLARKLCTRCRQAYVPDQAELDSVGWDVSGLGDLPQLYRPAGCPACSGTGYHGRFAIHEVLLVTEDIERLIVERGHSEDIRKVAVAQGMLTLRESGLARVLDGMTSLEEVLRVVA